MRCSPARTMSRADWASAAIALGLAADGLDVGADRVDPGRASARRSPAPRRARRAARRRARRRRPCAAAARLAGLPRRCRAELVDCGRRATRRRSRPALDLVAQRVGARVDLADELGQLLAGAAGGGGLGLRRLGGLGDAGDRLAEPLDARAHGPRRSLLGLQLAAHGGGLLARLAGVLAGGRGGLVRRSRRTGGRRAPLAGALELAAGDLQLAAEAGDGGAQLVGVGAAGGGGLLGGAGEGGDLVDAVARGAHVGEHAAGAAVDLVDALGQVGRGADRPRRPPRGPDVVLAGLGVQLLDAAA